MKQAMHLFRKDLRRLWPLVVLLLVLIAVWLAFALQDPLTTERVFVVPQLLLAIILTTGLLIQQEPLVGSTAFWMTRPIRRGSLMLAKAGFLGVFVVMPPVAANLFVFWHYGMEASRLPSALFEVGGPILSATLMSVVLAGITPNLPVYLVTCFAAALVVGVAGSLLNIWVDPFEDAGPTRLIIVTASVVLISGLLSLHQYLTRRTKRSAAGTALGTALLVVVGWLWP